MYTQCPDCSTAFRVTAEVLKQAAGQVRCGGCGNPFDALEHLSENMPDRRPASDESTPIPELIPELTDTNASLPKSISAEQSAALLKTLDELAGSDIQIEDTGVEWRIIDEHDVNSSDASTDTPVDEIRFDDNTPLPDDFHDVDESPSLSVDNSDNADDEPEPAPEQPQVDLALSEPEEWSDILGEFSDPVDEVDVVDDIEAADDLESLENTENDGDAETKLLLDDVEDSQLDFVGEHEEPTEEASIEDELAALGDAENVTVNDPPVDDPAIEEQNIAPPSDEEQTRNMMIDEELMALAIEDKDGFASTIIISDDDLAAVRSAQAVSVAEQGQDAASTLFETIIMEGESVLSDQDKDKLAADKTAAAEVAYINSATDTANEPPSHRVRYSIVGATGVLTLLLLVQVMHQSREALAKFPVFNDTIGPIYRALGQPLQPDWDITGWRFEATKGSADAEADDNTEAANEQITIYSRIGNQSDEALPYPLISISLTDRFEETIGSRMLEPAEYLSNDLDPRNLVQPGNTFDAVISIRTPSAETTGFKLDVCYRTSNEQLRCAIDDFK